MGLIVLPPEIRLALRQANSKANEARRTARVALVLSVITITVVGTLLLQYYLGR